MRDCFYGHSAASDWVARLLCCWQHRTQSPLFSSLNGHFKLRIPSKGSPPSMFQSDFPSGSGTVLFKAVNPHPLVGSSHGRASGRRSPSCSDPTHTHHWSTSLWRRLTSAHDATPYGLQYLGPVGCGLLNRSSKSDTDGTLARQLGQLRRPCPAAASLIGAP